MTAEQLQWAVLGLGAAVLVLLILMVLLLARVGRRPNVNTAGLGQGQAGEVLSPILNQLLPQLASLQSGIGANAARQGLEDQVWQRISHIENLVTALNQVPSTQQALTDQLNHAVLKIGEVRSIQEQEIQRWPKEDKAHESLDRLNAVMVGSANAGVIGENIVANLLSPLPAQWIVVDHKVDGGKVEFAVQLPDGFVLPIDSKIVAQQDLVDLESAQDLRQQTSLKNRIRDQVLKKAEEVHKYVDERSVGFAIMALTDAAYGVAGSALSEAYQKFHVLLVPFSLLAPFSLMIYEQHRHGGDLDTLRMARLLDDVQSRLKAAADIVSGHLSTAVTMATNARDRLAGELAAAAIALEQTHTANGAVEPVRESRSA